MWTFDLIDWRLLYWTIIWVSACYLLLRSLLVAMSTFRGEERLLGVRVQFHLDQRGWFWKVLHHDVTIDPAMRFGSRLVARVSVMSCIFTWALHEECTAVSIPLPPDFVAEGDDRPPSVGG